MTEMTGAERRAARDAAEREGNANHRWGITYHPDPRSEAPEALAAQAFARGDMLFQIDLPIFYVQGFANLGSTQTRQFRPESAGDFIGRIEAVGWHLEHLSTAYVSRGASATRRPTVVVGTNADDQAEHGELVGTYVFRRQT